jgi:hypothetical protein
MTQQYDEQINLIYKVLESLKSALKLTIKSKTIHDSVESILAALSIMAVLKIISSSRVPKVE